MALKVKWEVEGAGVHYTKIADEDLADCGTDAERNAMIDAIVQEDFEQKVGWGIISTNEHPELLK